MPWGLGFLRWNTPANAVGDLSRMALRKKTSASSGYVCMIGPWLWVHRRLAYRTTLLVWPHRRQTRHQKRKVDQPRLLGRSARSPQSRSGQYGALTYALLIRNDAKRVSQNTEANAALVLMADYRRPLLAQLLLGSQPSIYVL